MKKLYSGLMRQVKSNHDRLTRFPMAGRFEAPEEGERFYFSNVHEWISTSAVKNIMWDLNKGVLRIYTLNSIYEIEDVQEVK